MPRPVLELDGLPVLWRSQHDQTCEGCKRSTSIGIGCNDYRDYPHAWVCVRCLLAAIVEALA